MKMAGAQEGFPRQYGKYQLLARIGHGGMAEVYRARLPGVAGFEKIVVIKRLLPHLASDSNMVEMFVNEAKLAAEVQHRNVVQVFELGQIENGEFYMAMEHVAGTDLRQILRAAAINSMRIPPWFSVHAVAEVIDGLAYAHELADDQGRKRNVVHRDVTPANIFIAYLGDIKLGDFGVAKDDSRHSLTRAGQLKGKVPYMSPEQLYGRELDARTDVFAAGVVLWECLTQRRLFGGRPDIEAMNLICYGERKPPSLFAPDVPRALDDCVLRALAPDPEKRTSSARQLRDELHEILPLLRERVLQKDVRSIVESLLGNRDPSAGTGPRGISDEAVVRHNFFEHTPGANGTPPRSTQDLPLAAPPVPLQVASPAAIAGWDPTRNTGSPPPSARSMLRPIPSTSEADPLAQGHAHPNQAQARAGLPGPGEPGRPRLAEEAHRAPPPGEASLRAAAAADPYAGPDPFAAPRSPVSDAGDPYAGPDPFAIPDGYASPGVLAHLSHAHGTLDIRQPLAPQGYAGYPSLTPREAPAGYGAPAPARYGTPRPQYPQYPPPLAQAPGMQVALPPAPAQPAASWIGYSGTAYGAGAQPGVGYGYGGNTGSLPQVGAPGSGDLATPYGEAPPPRMPPPISQQSAQPISPQLAPPAAAGQMAAPSSSYSIIGSGDVPEMPAAAVEPRSPPPRTPSYPGPGRSEPGTRSLGGTGTSKWSAPTVQRQHALESLPPSAGSRAPVVASGAGRGAGAEPRVTDDFPRERLASGDGPHGGGGDGARWAADAVDEGGAPSSGYQGPHPFWVQLKGGKILGPLSLTEAQSIVRYECQCGHLDDVLISGDCSTWMELSTFAVLTGQEILLDRFASREKELPKSNFFGNLHETTATTLFARLWRERPTGRLVISAPGAQAQRRELLISEGRPTFVYANAVELQLPELLCQRNIIAKDVLPEVMHRALVEDRALERVVADRTRQDLSRAFSLLMRERMIDLFRWGSARFALDSGAPLTHTTPFAPSFLCLLPDMVQRAKSPDVLREALRPYLDARLERSERFSKGVAELRLNEAQTQAVNALSSGALTLGEVLQRARDERLHLTMAYILVETDLLLQSL